MRLQAAKSETWCREFASFASLGNFQLKRQFCFHLFYSSALPSYRYSRQFAWQHWIVALILKRFSCCSQHHINSVYIMFQSPRQTLIKPVNIPVRWISKYYHPHFMDDKNKTKVKMLRVYFQECTWKCEHALLLEQKSNWGCTRYVYINPS